MMLACLERLLERPKEEFERPASRPEHEMELGTTLLPSVTLGHAWRGSTDRPSMLLDRRLAGLGGLSGA